MKQFQVLDMDAMALRAEHLSVSASHVQPSCGDVQIPKNALGPTVNAGGLVPTPMANGVKPFVGLYMDMRVCRLSIDWR